MSRKARECEYKYFYIIVRVAAAAMGEPTEGRWANGSEEEDNDNGKHNRRQWWYKRVSRQAKELMEVDDDIISISGTDVEASEPLGEGAVVIVQVIGDNDGMMLKRGSRQARELLLLALMVIMMEMMAVVEVILFITWSKSGI